MTGQRSNQLSALESLLSGRLSKAEREQLQCLWSGEIFVRTANRELFPSMPDAR